MQSPHLFGICIASGATCLSPLTAVNLFVWLYLAVSGDENGGRYHFFADLVLVQYQFPRRLVYGFFGAETVVSNLYESGIIGRKAGIAASSYWYH